MRGDTGAQLWASGARGGATAHARTRETARDVATDWSRGARRLHAGLGRAITEIEL